MKTRMAFLLILLLLAGCGGGGGGGGGGGDNGGDDTSTVLRVGLGQDYGSIQAALNVAESGNVIEVHPGTYEENNIEIDKEITLRSTNPDDPAIVAQTIIKASGMHNAGIKISSGAGEAKVRGLTVEGIDFASFGINSQGSSATIEKNIITGFGYGIFAVGGVLKINDNTLSDHTTGIVLQGAGDIEADISGNDIHDNTQFGIEVMQGAKRVSFIGNKARRNGTAVQFRVIEDSIFIIRENTIDGNRRGIWLDSGSELNPSWIKNTDIKIEDNTIVGNESSGSGAGIRIDIKDDRGSNSRKIRIDGNTIEDNEVTSSTNHGGGIYIGAQNSFVFLTNNKISGNRIANTSASCAGAGVFVDRSGADSVSYLVDDGYSRYELSNPNWGGNTIKDNMNGNSIEDNVCPTSFY